MDKKNNQIINSTCSFPLAADGSEVSAYADYTLTSKIVSKDINFNLHFNYPIKSSTMTSSTLGVKDVNNKLVEGTTISAENDRKTWHLLAPSTGYTENEFYTFFVKPMMKTDGDNSLSKGEEMEFYVIQ